MRARLALLGIDGVIVRTVGGAPPYATIAGGPVNDGVVQGCYHSGANLKGLLAGETSCGKGYAALTRNQQGLQGPPGAAGPRWPAGTSAGAIADGNALLILTSDRD